MLSSNIRMTMTATCGLRMATATTTTRVTTSLPCQQQHQHQLHLLRLGYLVHQHNLAASFASSTSGESQARLKFVPPPQGTNKLNMSMSIFGRVYNRIFGRPTNFQVSPYGSSLLASCQRVKLEVFIEELGLPDTFFTWFLVTQLHVWMISSRLMADGSSEAKEVRNAMIKMLWGECEERMKLIGGIPPGQRRKNLRELSEQSNASLIIYDLGSMGSDVDLSEAVGQILFGHLEEDELPDAEKLEMAVSYIRRTQFALDNMDINRLVTSTYINWLPLKVDKKKKQDSKT